MGYSCIFIFIQPLYTGVLCIVLSPSCKEEEVCECLLRSNDLKKTTKYYSDLTMR